MGLEFFSTFWWQLLLVAVICYFFGAINFAIFFSKLLRHDDIRNHGSGNPGTTNIFRTYGLAMGALTFLFDALKGVAVCLLCRYIFAYTDCQCCFMYFAGFFVVLGHIFPPYLKFRGGKGVATSIGVCFVLQPLYMLCCALPAIIIIIVSDRMSVMSILYACCTVMWHWLFLRDEVGWLNCAMISCIFALVLFAHRHNILRLVQGKELPTGIRKVIFSKHKTSNDSNNTEENS